MVPVRLEDVGCHSCRRFVTILNLLMYEMFFDMNVFRSGADMFLFKMMMAWCGVLIWQSSWINYIASFEDSVNAKYSASWAERTILVCYMVFPTNKATSIFKRIFGVRLDIFRVRIPMRTIDIFLVLESFYNSESHFLFLTDNVILFLQHAKNLLFNRR